MYVKNITPRVLSEKTQKKIFQNFKEIFEITTSLWQNLENAFMKWPEEQPMIGEIFLDSVNRMTQEYTKYINGFPSALKTLLKIKKNNSDLYELVKNAQISRESSKNSEVPLPLHCLILLPVYRCFEYESYIRQLKDLTSPSNEDFEFLILSEMKIVNLNRDVFEDKSYLYRISKILNLISSSQLNPKSESKAAFLHLLLKESDYIPRSYVREGYSYVYEIDLRPCFLYLFNDMLVVCDIRNEEKFFSELYPLQNCIVEDVAPPPYTDHTICLTCENEKSIVLSFSTGAEKISWIEDISLQASLLQRKITTDEKQKKTVQELPEFSKSFLHSFNCYYNHKNVYSLAENMAEEVQIEKASRKVIFTREIVSPEQEIKEYCIFAKGRSLIGLEPKSDSHYSTCCKVEFMKNRCIIACAGSSNKAADPQFSMIAINTFLESTSAFKNFGRAREYGEELLRILNNINHNVISTYSTKHAYDLSFIGGVIVSRKGEKGNTFIGVSVGSFNLYNWSNREHIAREVHSSNEIMLNHSFSGNLGAAYANGCPNLKGLKLFMVNFSTEEDLIFLSKGMHDNLDPVNKGISPLELTSLMQLDSVSSSWDEMNESESAPLRRAYKEKMLSSIISEVEYTPLLPSRLLQHVKKLTKNRRDFKYKFPKRRAPSNKKLYPGVLEDALAVVVQGSICI
eukprot:TRINITY_DN4477_c0_g1_i2.p1 TRINITY_DN4477_c0_g1~~TRINITY_DN4477_c0_g1_i2.p1  ORF type:complete len:683 (-),score=112.42 TRINITY_DN4477_c0_g1_i2:48-2096(-)